MDNNAVVYSLDFIEDWLEKSIENNVETALQHLKIIEDAFHENRRSLETLRTLLKNLKTQVDTGAQL